MDPYQQYQSPNQGNPYDFIMNPAPPPKKKIGLGGNNFILTIGLIVGGAVAFMIILAIILSMVSGDKVGKADLISVAQTQNELVRVSEQGTGSATQQVTKNLAVTIQYTMKTQQLQILKFLADNGTELGKKELALKQNAATDQQFTSAKTTSTFDLVYAQTMQNQLSDYANSLKQLHARAVSNTEREMFSDYYEQTQLLISQIPYTQDSIESAGQ